jgi:hypothetical protein
MISTNTVRRRITGVGLTVGGEKSGEGSHRQSNRQDCSSGDDAILKFAKGFHGISLSPYSYFL